MIRRRTLIIFFICFLIAALALLWRLGDHDLDQWTSESFTFEADGVRLTGTLWLPAGPPIAAIGLVHGDGPQDRISGGGYAPLINGLLDAGIAVASWDKPGVGSSQGNWLDQSMQGRASETGQALRVLRSRLEGVTVGALGFSQAGWVLPRLLPEEASFMVLVGPAISWRDQGAYYTRTRLKLAGKNEVEITQALAKARIENERLFGPDSQYTGSDSSGGMDKARWSFIKRNRGEDARAYLGGLNVPVLAVWGQDDLNVDAKADAAIYREILGQRHSASRIIILPQATHGLLKASSYNTQLVSEWPWYITAQFILEGRYAYAPGAIDRITGWIREHGATARQN